MDESQDVSRLRRALLNFYRKRARDLPWRATKNPYEIWVSEVMLQQTQVVTVKDRYPAFLSEFPTVFALAEANEERVCEAWAGLGYYHRARNMHRAAKQVVDQYQGEFPSHLDGLRELAGVGAYTAGAVASIAFDRRVPAVDGNAERVISRLLAVTRSSAGQRISLFAAELAQSKYPGDVNQALMELGATVCRPTQPDCPYCPLRRSCAAAANGDPERYPGAKLQPAKKDYHIAFAWVRARCGGVWLEQRELGGLWPGLWQLPGVERDASKNPVAHELEAELGEKIGARTLTFLGTVSQVLSHREAKAVVYLAGGARRLRTGRRRKRSPDPLSEPLTGPARKAVQLAEERAADR